MTRRLIVVVLLASAAAAGQTIFGAIVGTVTDPSQAVVPAAQVTVTNQLTNEKRDFRTDGVGNYELNNLFPGLYVLEVEMAGFSRYRRERIELSANQNLRVNVELQPAAAAASVTVSAEGGPAVESETARLSDIRSLRQLQTLPTAGRSIWRFIALTPGVTGGVGGTLSVSGSRSRQVDYAIDGVSLGDAGTNNAIGPTLSYMEAFEEVRIDLGNNSAEFKGLGTLSVVSKRGGNELHGAVTDYYSTGVLRAGEYFTHRRSGTPSHGFSAAASGPLYVPKLYEGRDRTFWYTSYETNFTPMASSTFLLSAPLAAWKRGDFSSERSAVRDPLANNTPFAGNRVPEARLSNVARQYFPLWPDPNYGDTSTFAAQNYRNQIRSPIEKPLNWNARVDHRISNGNTVFGRVLMQRTRNLAFESGLPGTLGVVDQVRRIRHFLVSDTHIFRPTLINEFRFGIAYNSNPLQPASIDGPAFLKATGLTNVTRDGQIPNVPQIPTVGFTTGYGLQAISPNRQRLYNQDLTLQWQDTVSWITGQHSLRMGMEISKRRRLDQNQSTNLFGSFTFSNRYTGFNFADFVLGIPTSMSRSAYARKQEDHALAYDFFVQDNYKISSSLTLNLGLRYELHPAWTNSGNRLSAFDSASGAIVVPDAALPLVSDLFPVSLVPVIGHSKTRFHDRLLATDGNNWAPRVGFAWRPLGSPGFVVRSGYGIFYEAVARQTTIFGPPFIVNEPSYTNPTDVRDAGFVQWPLAFPRGPRLAGVSLPTSVALGFRTPYSQNWNFTLEKEVARLSLRASYVGTGGRKLPYNHNLNQPRPGPGAYIDKPRPFPNLQAIRETRNGASHTYHGLQLEAERRMFRGMQFQTAFTWAKNLGNDVTPENTFDLARERGQQQMIPCRRWTGFFIYELPVGKGRKLGRDWRGFMGQAVSGWEVGGMWATQDGQNVTPAWTMPDIHGIQPTSSRTPPLTGYRPDSPRDPNLPPGEQSIERWYDVSAFRMPAVAGVFGNCTRGIIRGPAVRNLNASLYKNFTVRERFRVRLGAQATNVFNHPNYSNLSGSALLLDNTSLRGRITSVGGATSDTIGDIAGTRVMRLDLRVEF